MHLLSLTQFKAAVRFRGGGGIEKGFSVSIGYEGSHIEENSLSQGSDDSEPVVEYPAYFSRSHVRVCK